MGNSKAKFINFVSLPDIITGAGQYLTRKGETVTILRVSTVNNFRYQGVYLQFKGYWHKSGRLYFNGESNNDIVTRKIKR